MNATRQQVQMAAKLYECRDTAKRLFGDGYKTRMDAYSQTIKSMVKTTDMNELQAAMHAAKELGGMAAICYLAAFVEMTEPSCHCGATEHPDYIRLAGRCRTCQNELDSQQRGAIKEGMTFVGTTGHADFLDDENGNRRFWPITGA